ncbi:MAG: hypothetical protein AB7V56_12045 [Candidatus Nitrosocosmicus sp.]|jgi:hypothetical protein|uniref:hypothetical protein n=1 Tax=Candidatus Nitrosocosmicus agrestis TaxID=2563600 RepID=UPI00122E98E4|nr:hypothetical protein [Candidatus Nitrosocosmicus sp. SS]KAA2280460.1 hypothetical protein F1Z66_10700 [Candidatus Nitrosocosmicus sp. SS]KAF0869238.1 hypothetical protein E5N71_05905 [Candidatus Nitrosocosmicus sp. SS]MDR4492771.1 hypothetical protein [Candidatus Nitrosocosmicus sp.]
MSGTSFRPMGSVISVFKSNAASEFTIQMLEVNGILHNKINSLGFESVKCMGTIKQLTFFQ